MLAYPSMSGDRTLQEEALKMASMRAEAKDAAMYTFESPMSRRMNDRVEDHQMKLQEHRQKLDQHKLYLMHIAAEADIAEQQEDSSNVPTINRKSRSLVGERPDRVENILIAKGMEYKMDIESRRQDQEIQSHENNTFQPRICVKSKELYSDTNYAIHERLINKKTEYDEKKAKAASDAADLKNKQQIEADKGRRAMVLGPGEDGEGSNPQEFEPVITEKSARKHREYHDCLTWGEEQKKKKEETRERYEEQELAEVRPNPIISSRSRRLAEKQGREAKIEDTLLTWAESKKVSSAAKLKADDAVNCPHQPQITNYAAALKREGSVGDRLYNKAFEYKAKRAEEVERQMAEIESMANGGGRNPKRITSYSYEVLAEPDVRTLPIELDLQRREAERQQMRELYLLEKEEEEALMHYPRINAMSDLIAQQLPEDSVSRLLKPKVVWEAPPEDDDPNLTFKPRVNSKSLKINEEKLKRGEVGSDRNEYLYQKSEENKYRMEQARKRAMDKEMEKCTFQPNIDRNSQNTKTSNGSVVARTQAWQLKRNARMRKAREDEEKKEMEECTFKPNIASYKAKPKKKKPEFFGVDTHLERQAEARKQVELSKTIPHSTGEGWTNELTKPVEFTFNHKVKIKSLTKPVDQEQGEYEIEAKAEQAILRSQESQARLGYSMGASQASNGAASAEWMRRSYEKEQSEMAHAQAGMNSPRFYASDALNMHTGTPRGRTGEDDHVARMRAARMEKNQKDRAAASTTGEGWTGAVTQPVEFRFHDSRSLKVRALHKPVSPMVS